MDKDILLTFLRDEGFIGKSNVFLGIENKRWNKNKKERFRYLSDILIKKTSFLPPETPLKERRYYIEHNITSNNWKCSFPGCNYPRKYTNFKWGFSEICSSTDINHIDHRNNIMTDRLTSTVSEKYNVDNISKLDLIKFAKKASSQKKYGVNNVFQSLEVKTKIKKTNLDRYGVVNPSQSHDVIIRKNNIPRMRQLSKIDSIKLESIKSGVTKEYLEGFLNNNYLDVCSFQSALPICKTSMYKLFKEHHIKYKKRGPSNAEREIILFIQSLDPKIKIIQNSRGIIKPKELDIYLPEYNLAIEYNGLMFHSQGISKYSIFNTPDKDKKMHLKKTEDCEALDIQLLHINENEWLNPILRSIWESIIQNKLKKNSIKVGARKCRFATDIELKTLSKSFLDENHLQGSGAVGTIRYGLIYNNELVSLMTFGKARFSDADYELIRFANKKGFTVVGAASKLFKQFTRSYKNSKIVSYANRRWSDGGLYNNLGFKIKNIASPNYYYFHPNNIYKLFHRAGFQKHKLKDKLDIFSGQLTEQENMFNNGYRRIFDSGNYVFIKSI